MPEYKRLKTMSFNEAEKLSELASRWLLAGDIQSLCATQIMIAHWMRQSVGVGFSVFASQWVEAQRNGHTKSTAAMAEAWPFDGEYHMYQHGSVYYRRKVNPTARDWLNE